MPSKAGKRKTSYDFDATAKHKLEGIKSDLRLRGLTGISETAILEALINAANPAVVEEQLLLAQEAVRKAHEEHDDATQALKDHLAMMRAAEED